MYKIISIQRQGDSVFKSEYDANTISEANTIYDKEIKKSDVVDVKLMFCTEVKRFKKQNNQ